MKGKKKKKKKKTAGSILVNRGSRVSNTCYEARGVTLVDYITLALSTAEHRVRNSHFLRTVSRHRNREHDRFEPLRRRRRRRSFYVAGRPLSDRCFIGASPVCGACFTFVPLSPAGRYENAESIASWNAGSITRRLVLPSLSRCQSRRSGTSPRACIEEDLPDESTCLVGASEMYVLLLFFETMLLSGSLWYIIHTVSWI